MDLTKEVLDYYSTQLIGKPMARNATAGGLLDQKIEVLEGKIVEFLSILVIIQLLYEPELHTNNKP